MFADAIARIAESIFPIFFVTDEDIMGVCGTGFCIDESGLFVTADHFMTPIPGYTRFYYGRVPDALCQPAVEIERIASDPERDIFIGRVPPDQLRPVQLSEARVRPGDCVCLAGFPMAVVASTPDGGFTGNVRRYWQPTFVIDATRAVIDNRTYDGYIVQHPCLPGMSGGPAFDTDGNVCGMGLATLRRTIPDPNGSGFEVANGIVIDLEYVNLLLARR